MSPDGKKTKTAPLLKVNQWLGSWMPAFHRKKFPKEFYITSLPIKDLWSISDVSRRKLEDRKNGDVKTGYQRSLQKNRSAELKRYLEYGFPMSKEKSIENIEEHGTLINPGWLPTAILVNVIPLNDPRRRKGKNLFVNQKHKVSIDREKLKITYPVLDEGLEDSLYPLEIIDGQHRLSSIEDFEGELDSFEVPVVIFDGLSLELQAYLFWVINVEPVRINQSLAFDLYPELRNQDWLERGENIKVYRQHRAQELTEICWRHPESPWKDRIELLGNRVRGHVSNASFLRSLMTSFVRKWDPNDSRIGGLFGTVTPNESTGIFIPWKRTQQASFLIYTWMKLHEAVKNSCAEWAKSSRKSNRCDTHGLDPAFAGEHTLLATDQGVRAIMLTMNAMCYVHYQDLRLEGWESPYSSTVSDEEISNALKELKENLTLQGFLESLCSALVNDDFDLRISSSPDLEHDTEKRLRQGAFRGSSGYTALFQQCMKQLLNSDNKVIADTAGKVISRMGLDAEKL